MPDVFHKSSVYRANSPLLYGLAHFSKQKTFTINCEGFFTLLLSVYSLRQRIKKNHTLV
jgi:hypothetical protein